MTHDSVEEHLAELAELVAQAEAMGVDLWPESKPPRPWAKYALACFGEYLNRYNSCSCTGTLSKLRIGFSFPCCQKDHC